MTKKGVVYTRWEQDENGQWWHYGRSERLRGEERTCGICSKAFLAISSKIDEKHPYRYCSKQCANRAYKPKRYRKGPDSPIWRGGRSVHGDGYIVVYKVDDSGKRIWALEHREIMAQIIGRNLFDYETVHHKNGNKADNRIENLELRVGRHGVGATEAHCPTCTCFAHG